MKFLQNHKKGKSHFIFYLGFLSQIFTIHRTAGERGLSFNPLYQFHPLKDALKLAGWLLETAQLCAKIAAGLEPGTFDFLAQVANH